jgi:hypothetical protein
VSHPIRNPDVQDDIERKALLIESHSSAGKIVVEFNFKDGKWTPGNVSITFPRKHGE